MDRDRYLFADLKATLYNAHFDTKGEPWLADDFMGGGTREKRQRERMKERLGAFRHSGFAQKIAGDGEVPEWAREIERNRKQKVN